MQRRSELLNGLWSMGVRTYPVIGEFYDSFSGKVEDAYKKWGNKETVEAGGVDELVKLYASRGDLYEAMRTEPAGNGVENVLKEIYKAAKK